MKWIIHRFIGAAPDATQFAGGAAERAAARAGEYTAKPRAPEALVVGQFPVTRLTRH